MKRKMLWTVLVFATLGVAVPAMGANFELHGDLNHRFLLYTNHHDWLNPDTQGEINDETVSESYGEVKYRFWMDASSDDGAVKGVFAIEIGGIRFGESADGGRFSGDGRNLETRWAYLDMQLPGVDTPARFSIGLQPFTANGFLWQETATGVIYNGAPNDVLSYQLAWIRGEDVLARDTATDDFEDQDNYFARFGFKPADAVKLGLFGLYQSGDLSASGAAFTSRDYQVKSFAGNVDHQIFTVGLDGNAEVGDFFVNWDIMYQTGGLDKVDYTDFISGQGNAGDDFDIQAYFGHVDLGVKLSRSKLTYTFWYASGDDDPTDKDFDAFIATDLDRDDSIAIFEGLYTDDNSYFTERPYIADKGFIMNKLAFDHQTTEKFSWGAAALYMMTAEDLEYTDAGGTSRESSEIGFEIDAYVKYMLYKNVEVALNAGYLFAGDALDAFEVGDLRDGSSDENIWGSSMRIRYRF